MRAERSAVPGPSVPAAGARHVPAADTSRSAFDSDQREQSSVPARRPTSSAGPRVSWFSWNAWLAEDTGKHKRGVARSQLQRARTAVELRRCHSAAQSRASTPLAARRLAPAVRRPRVPRIGPSRPVSPSAVLRRPIAAKIRQPTGGRVASDRVEQFAADRKMGRDRRHALQVDTCALEFDAPRVGARSG